jgi:microcystin-dependent protein
VPRIIGVDKSGVPVGHIVQLANGSLTPGLLPCDGSAVSRTTYAALFAAIGTAYGSGDGFTTFNVPDYRGRTPIGDGTGVGLTTRTLGQQVGAETHTLTESQIPSHDHQTDRTLVNGLFQLGHNSQRYSGGGGDFFGEGGNMRTGFTGGSQAHNNMQPSLVCKFGIAYV